MLDFVEIKKKWLKDGSVEIFPDFIIDNNTKDLMIQGGDFYAVWNEENKAWDTNERTVSRIIDEEIKRVREEIVKAGAAQKINCRYMRYSSTGSIDKWHKYVQKQMRDSFKPLNQKIIFSNTPTKRSDYSSKALPYPIEKGKCAAYDKIMSRLYFPEEREKLEWAVGSIISGDSKKIQKFIVLYGGPGSGKSTFLHILELLFDGYYAYFDAKEMASMNNMFALESFNTDPLVGIQHDGNLSKITDNSLLNSIVSHETLVVNEKFKRKYERKFNAFLFMGTNNEIKITDAKAGLMRRLIIVQPSGRLLEPNEYDDLIERVKFELGAIAHHCLQVYNERGPKYYSNYIPRLMISSTNDVYDFIEESFDDFVEHDPVTLATLWSLYKQYCNMSNINYPMKRIELKSELMNYYDKWEPRTDLGRNTYTGFKTSMFDYQDNAPVKKELKVKSWLEFNFETSIFDEAAAEYKAQYATSSGIPKSKWECVKTVLSDLDTKKLHYVRLPENYIIIDFDLKDENGEKNLELNKEAASKWPETYAELSKSGAGIHLHYFYDGDVLKLSTLYSDGIEIKVFKGNSALRRKLSLCNGLAIATINSGLPLKGEKQVINQEAVKSERKLRDLIKRNLRKEIHPGTKPSVDFIYKILEDAYQTDLKYDVSDLHQSVLNFALRSSNHSDYCAKLVSKMHFKSEVESDGIEGNKDMPIIFYDVEVFPNLFLVNWKFQGSDAPVVRMINPSGEDLLPLFTKYRMIGFNNRRYDNHIMYARYQGYTNEQLFKLSSKIIQGHREAFFGEAYNLSYADVYDFSSKKQGLKKWEIELGIHHKELGLPWDQPVPEDKWDMVAEYCDNDVIATEVVFNHLQEDFNARQILAALSGLTVNDTTRQHATKFMFGDDRHPDLVYTDLSTIFPGYEFKDGHSSYMDEDPSEGGYVFAKPGAYGGLALMDIQSMHPNSARLLGYFGSYEPRFDELLKARIAVKHHDRDTASKLLNGVLAPYLGTDEEMDSLAHALKIVINSVYGYTSASFDNPFKDPRNIDNIIAKRGALFMITLKHAVINKGFSVAHIKTDSIKIPDATPEIISFIEDFGKQYGYTFEHEATYDRMCLVNDAVYIARYKGGKKDGQWVAVGAQFQHPYVFKKLFSHERIEFDDLCETKTVTSALYLDMNEGLNEEDHRYSFVGRAGRFCPMKEGYGGGLLMREKDGKYYAATGTKGYRWLESEQVKEMGLEDGIDVSYFDLLADKAKEAISQYTDFDWFVSDEPYNGELPYTDNYVELPWDE